MPDKFTLRQKLILGGFAVIFLPLLITGFVVSSRLTDSLLEIYRQKSIRIAKDMAVIVDISLRDHMRLTSAVALDRELVDAVAAEDFDSASKRLVYMYKKIGVQDGTLLLADRNGIVVADVRDGSWKGGSKINISDRDYFKQAKKGVTGMGGPLVSRYSGELIFMIAEPVMVGGGFCGAVVMGFDMDFLIDITSSIRVGRSGYAFVTDRDGTLIIHPQKEYILKLNMYREPGMERIAPKIVRGETGADSYTFRGTRKIAGFTPIGLTGWNVAFTQDRDEIMKPVNGIMLFLIFSMLFFCLLAIVLIVIFSKSISTPVQKVVEQLNQLMLHSENIIMNIGLDRRITFVNSAFEKIFGIPGAEVIGTEPLLANTAGQPSAVIWEELEKGVTWSGNVTMKKRDGTGVTLAVLIIPIMNYGGKLQGYLKIARNITDELLVESRLQQSQKMEALGAMAGGIAHDFNNILSGVLGYSELSLLVPGNPAKTETYLREILKASERARDLISQILTFSRQTEPEMRQLVPKYIVKEAIKLLRASIPSTIEIQENIVSEATIVAEPIQIHQIIVNLCTNAVHAIGLKTGTISISLEDMFVEREFAARHPGLEPGDHICLRISDSGSGIDPAVMEHIFEPFFTTKPQGEGTGLGLSVIHGIVNKLNGIITVYSDVGKGTAFTIILPVCASDTSGDVKQHKNICGGTERILLIDDEKTVSDPLEIILRNLGYSVRNCSDGAIAVDLFAKDPDAFDIVITDYSMPHMTGLELAERIKHIRSDVPVIVHSGYLTRQITEMAASLGVYRVLLKPVNTYQLADVIRMAFDGPAESADNVGRPKE